MDMYSQFAKSCQPHLPVLWGNLSRFNNLLIVLNISVFFLSGLIAQGYYYTFFSLGCLVLVGLGTLLPGPLMGRLWFYLANLAFEAVGAYFLLASILYWVRTGGKVVM